MTSQDTPRLFLYDGVIQALFVTSSIVNLFKDIQIDASWPPAAIKLAGDAGASAVFASLTMYDGEDVEHVALLINERLAIGTFEWLKDLTVGDDVRLVVSKTDSGPLYVHAILRVPDQLLWTPISIDHTRRGWIMHALKLGGLILAFTWLMSTLCFLFNDSILNTMDLIIVVIFPLLLMGFVMFMSTRDVMALGEQAEQIFQTLGVPDFERFRIKRYSVCRAHFSDDPNSLKKGHIFYFSDALAAHKRRLNLP